MPRHLPIEGEDLDLKIVLTILPHNLQLSSTVSPRGTLALPWEQSHISLDGTRV